MTRARVPGLQGGGRGRKAARRPSLPRFHDTPSPLEFFSRLNWIDGRPLTIEPYRQRIFTEALYTFDADGWPVYNQELAGRGKKNFKTADLILSGSYRFFVWPSAAGNDCLVCANDEGQAGDDLDLLKKLIAANPILAREVDVKTKEIVRRDGKGRFRILPAQNAIGEHGKTYLWLGFDEIHGHKDYTLLEALALDPTRRDAFIWITTYASLRHVAGVPLHDLFEAGRRGTDPRMHFSWYSGSYTSDRDFAGEDLTPEQRANPSMASWGNDGYLDQQRARLPRHRYRRLHLNEPGSPDGAAFSADAVLAAIVTGRKRLPPEVGREYRAGLDMSGGTNDHAVLAIGHWDDETKRAVLDVLISQTGAPPFNPRDAVKKFAGILKEYGVYRVVADAYAGRTFQSDFEGYGIAYEVCRVPKSELYNSLDPRLNASEVELLDVPELQEQLLTLVLRAGKIDHLPGDHDDHVNSAALVCWLLAQREPVIPFIVPYISSGPTGMSSRDFDPMTGQPLRGSDMWGPIRGAFDPIW